MKNIFIRILIFIALFSNTAYSMYPTYELTVKNYTYIADNILEFDIFLKHTNPSQTSFEYSMGQYVLTGNYLNYISTYAISPNSPFSDLPPDQVPINPVKIGNELRLTSNVPKNPGTGYMISSTGDGTKIVRMRLVSSYTYIVANPNGMNLRWKNSSGLFTKIINSNSTENRLYNITNPAFHYINNNPTNTITGKVFVDYNNNGVKDSGEPFYFNGSLQFRNTTSSIFNLTGMYSIQTWFGQHTVRFLNYSGLQANPLIRTVNFTSAGQISENNDFALSVTSPRQNLQIIIVPVYKPRPGFQSVYNIYYQNIGTNVVSGILELNYQTGSFSFQSSIPIQTFSYINGGYGSVSWIYNNLNPGERRVVQVNLLTNNLYIGYTTRLWAKINPITGDFFPDDNIFSLVETVVGSFDPNDKNVSPSGIITQEDVINENRLNYTVRFQNTGNDTAFTVRILDTLSQNINTDSLQILGSSHDFSYAISEDNIIEWTFDNILLPDSTTNEPESHGFIVYSVKPKNNLMIGDSINNTAYIYFDFNEPVVTNTVNTVVGIRNKYLDLSWRLQSMFPVPDTLFVKLRNSSSPYDVVDSAKVFAESYPSYFRKTTELLNNNSGNAYYITANHRNSLETWSAEPVFILPDTTYYDFTSSLSQAYGNNMILVDSVASFYSGDVNQDGTIELSDVLQIFNDASSFILGNSDLNGDGITDLNDLTIVFNNASTFIHVIKP